MSVLAAMLILVVLYFGYFKMQSMTSERSVGITAIDAGRAVACRTQRQAVERDIEMWSVDHPDDTPTLASLERAGVQHPELPGGWSVLAGREAHVLQPSRPLGAGLQRDVSPRYGSAPMPGAPGPRRSRSAKTPRKMRSITASFTSAAGISWWPSHQETTCMLTPMMACATTSGRLMRNTPARIPASMFADRVQHEESPVPS